MIENNSPELELQLKRNAVRAERARRLNYCDWTQLPDVQLSEEKKQEWAVYRQQLRDMIENVNVNDVQWPTPPARD